MSHCKYLYLYKIKTHFVNMSCFICIPFEYCHVDLDNFRTIHCRVFSSSLCYYLYVLKQDVNRQSFQNLNEKLEVFYLIDMYGSWAVTRSFWGSRWRVQLKTKRVVLGLLQCLTYRLASFWGLGWRVWVSTNWVILGPEMEGPTENQQGCFGSVTRCLTCRLTASF